MKFFTRYKKIISSFFLLILLSAPMFTMRAQQNVVAEDTTQTEIQKESLKERKPVKLDQQEETKSDIYSYTFVFYLIYKFISSFTKQNE